MQEKMNVAPVAVVGNKNEIILNQKELSFDSVPNPTLVKDNTAELDPSVERKLYMQQWDPAYLKQIELLNGEINLPMDKDTELVVCVPVAGHQEFENIYKTIESFSRQDIENKKFEILLLVNVPEKLKEEKKKEIEATLSEIERAKKDFPGLQVMGASVFLPEDQVRIGNIRKIVTDLSLLRQEKSKIEDRDVILVSNDADNQGISEQYVRSYVDYFKENPQKEGAVGNLQFDPNAFVRFPVVHTQQELATFLDQTGFRNGNVMLFGGNSCMKTSIYSSIGGYPGALKTAEQNWTGDTIRKLRKTKSTLGFVEGSLLTTSSRRGVASYLSGNKTVEFGDALKEAEMRATNIESFPIFDYANKEEIQKLKIQIEKTLNTGVDQYETGEHLGKDAFYYKSNIKKIGFEYELDEHNNIYITNMDRFIERQEIMQGLIKGGEKNMAKVIELAR